MLISGRSQQVYFRIAPSTLGRCDCASSSKLKKSKSTFCLSHERILEQERSHMSHVIPLQCSNPRDCHNYFLWAPCISQLHVFKSTLEYYTTEPSFGLISSKHSFVCLLWKSFCPYVSPELGPRSSPQLYVAHKWACVKEGKKRKRQLQWSVWGLGIAATLWIYNSLKV